MVTAEDNGLDLVLPAAAPAAAAEPAARPPWWWRCWHRARGWFVPAARARTDLEALLEARVAALVRAVEDRDAQIRELTTRAAVLEAEKAVLEQERRVLTEAGERVRAYIKADTAVLEARALAASPEGRHA